MRPLEQLERIDAQIRELLANLPVAHDRGADSRRRLHGDLASFWSTPDSQGQTPRQRLLQLRKAQLIAEARLRQDDQTLTDDQAALLRVCLASPLAAQRRHLPLAERSQVYRVLIEGFHPNWRSYLPGVLVIVAGSAEGQMLTAQASTGTVLLCGLTQGIEAFDTLGDLHQELCERLDDPLQSQPLLRLYGEGMQAERIHHAQRLRYDWYADSLLDAQIDALIEAQRQRLNDPGLWPDAAPERITTALALDQDIDSRALVQTRYSLLLEKNLPHWLRNASPQGLSHIMQTMQELVAAAETAAAPGILDIEAFSKQHSLLAWTNARLAERLRSDLGTDFPPGQILVSVVRARRTGAILHPFATSAYVTTAGMKRVGDDMIEMVKETRSLDQLALHNLPWFDADYWLTAQVTHLQGTALPPGLSPGYVKALVRELNVGGSYAQFLQTQLISSRAGKWRLRSHAQINRARMRAEAAKARYAGHFGDDAFELGYQWVTAVLDQPHNALRPLAAGYAIKVRQLRIIGHTLQGVLLINSTAQRSPSCVLYTPDAPDRRAWRRFHNTRELIRTLRQQPRLSDYVIERLPLLPAARVRRLLTKGRLGPALQTPEIEDDLFYACYMAEARAVLADADAKSRTTREVDAQSIVDLSWRLVDFISLLLPNRALLALSVGRMAIDIWDGFEAYKQDDVEGVLRHAYDALSHANDAAIGYSGSGLLRRSLRGMPKQPPLPLPTRFEVQVAPSTLRYRIDGIYGEGVYEQVSPFAGLSLYFVKDKDNRHYKVSFDGQRWRAIDPEQPDAYLQQPVKRTADGRWVIDSPLHWYEGLPDVQRMLDDCYLEETLDGVPLEAEQGLHEADGQLYLVLRMGQLPVRRHLLPDRFHLPIPAAREAGVVPWAVLRWEAGKWLIRVRQAGRSSDWLPLPDAPAQSD
ncbi:dermonecrotic toxin domain-containing protein [Pseudomonas plecoglossicida]|uniref:dermonecrotic toxin domain-containing protein n=1 Tax=Pseudomonas plecoglossicida TaxID=70775 RepID=UPI000490BF7C|nr:DUF6543 domain-containing protein [Pseudomonas plecoglossicida]GLR36694.1 hypothetical protein GCM10011247_20910 [Pseudomonas plecoglossicida]